MPGYALDRITLKARARDALRPNRILCIGVCLVLNILLAFVGYDELRRVNINGHDWFVSVTSMPVKTSQLLALILVINVVSVGVCRFFLNNRENRGEFSDLFFGFRENYANIVRARLRMDIGVFLWSLLLIVPGIVKMLSWAMVPYLLAENPDMPGWVAMKKSEELMYGHKLDYFILLCSFIGWMILGVMTCGIVLVVWTIPYIEATDAEWYRALVGERESQKAYIDV